MQPTAPEGPRVQVTRRPIRPSRTEPAHARPLQDDSAARPLTAVLTCGPHHFLFWSCTFERLGDSGSSVMSERHPAPLKRNGERGEGGRGSSAGCHLHPTTRRGCQMPSGVNLNKISHRKATQNVTRWIYGDYLKVNCKVQINSNSVQILFFFF